MQDAQRGPKPLLLRPLDWLMLIKVAPKWRLCSAAGELKGEESRKKGDKAKTKRTTEGTKARPPFGPPHEAASLLCKLSRLPVAKPARPACCLPALVSGPSHREAAFCTLGENWRHSLRQFWPMRFGPPLPLLARHSFRQAGRPLAE